MKTSGGWIKSIEHNRLDDKTYTVFSLYSADHSGRLDLACESGAVSSLVIQTGKILDGGSDASARIRFDGEAAMSAGNGDMVGNNLKSWMLYPGELFTPLIIRSNRVLIELPIFEAGSHVWEFHPKGLNVGNLAQVCGDEAIVASEPPPTKNR
jgi:hypothetical protein